MKTCKQCDQPLDISDTCYRCGYHQTNRGFQGAWKKGYNTERGSTSPYPDKRAGRHNHIVTFSRAFDRYWQLGYAWRSRLESELP